MFSLDLYWYEARDTFGRRVNSLPACVFERQAKVSIHYYFLNVSLAKCMHEHELYYAVLTIPHLCATIQMQLSHMDAYKL